TATLSYTTGTVSWSLTGPGSITPATGNTTSYTPPTSVASATTATLAASSGSLSSNATITINPPAAITVAGTVVDNQLRRFAGVSVIIGGQSTVSDASGHFSIANVTPPYDLTALATTGGDKAGSLYKGLTRTDPTILVALNPTSTDNTGTLTGTVTGGDPLGTAGENTRIAWGSTQANQFQNAGDSISSSPYSLMVSWDAALPSITGNMHVLQWAEDGNGLPASYKGYAVKTGVAVAAGGTTNNVNLAMSAPGTSNVGGSVTVPAGVTLDGKLLSVSFDDSAAISLGSDASAGTSFSYLYPNVTGATASIGATGSNAGGDAVAAQTSGIALGTTNVSIALPAPISAVLPANTATGIGTNTDFSWTAFAGGNAVYVLLISGPSGQPGYAVFTTATTARIPDLSGQGLGLPPAASYSWNVLAISPHSSVDSAAGAKSILPTGNVLVDAQTKSRSFTTP
ncbi:MAG TPA: hypothetical protein VFN91_09235, partial [Myxococcaceae bacterium]|nr:hypothetical protein [Myxococcaceae bacterium]